MVFIVLFKGIVQHENRGVYKSTVKAGNAIPSRVVEWFVSDPTPDPDPTFKEVSAPTPDPDPVSDLATLVFRLEGCAENSHFIREITTPFISVGDYTNDFVT